MIQPTPEEFIKALFPRWEAGEGPVMGETRINPNTGETVFWAYPYPEQGTKGMHHLSLALQKRTAPYQTSRIVNFTGGMGLVLDDVLEKVPYPKVKPTWIMETKPGSQQWGYVFEEPLRDRVLFDRMIRAAAQSGISDPGMKNVVRWFRLPGSQPLGKKHPAKLLRWWPERRFRASSVLPGLGVFSLPPARPVWTSDEGCDGSGIDDRLFDWFKASGLVSAAASDGWFVVECPFWEEHSDSDRKAYYKPVQRGNPAPGFNCYHGHKQHGLEGLRLAEVQSWAAAQGVKTRKTGAEEFSIVESMDDAD
jgi:hypothetical protein